MSVVCFGEALIDFLSNGQTPESFTKFAGGAPANVAVAVAKQGISTSFCGMLGNDMFGEFLNQELQSHQVNTKYCLFTDKAKTALAFVSLDQHGERSFNFYRPPAADLLFRIDDFNPEMFHEHKLIHVCSNSLTESNIYKSTIYALTQAKKHGLTTSFDMNLRVNLWSSLNHTIERLWHVISLSDIVKLASDELEFLNQHSHAGHPKTTTIDAIMKANVKCLIITDGGNDIQYFAKNGHGRVTPPAVQAIDTTAAGDAFMGGLIAQLMAKHEHKTAITDPKLLAQFIKHASRCGAFAVTRKGAFSALPSQDDIKT
ncbi:carbohydrate kinase [Pseudoalteromonas sp. MMG012]|uniref:carbohydrate kinase family protein n=1 Tax=Pseudoalteromonas sp. MMG012 TaxID=2822686 RepID=UPI001B3A1F2C|nr:carbohydrate kinase [Pseudoalteromonas sp. MMG012]MBQ4850272.1 carbohydrate kinase [Pseudoalteromonas sp. MMG012]